MSGRVLLVEDARLEMELCQNALKIGRHTVFAVGTVAEACEVVARQPLDVAVVDLILPDGNGMEVLKAIRAVQPSCQVVVLTAHGGLDTAMEALRRGAHDYLRKPFDFIKVNLVVDRCLELLDWRRRTEQLERTLKEGRD